jgi:hypothetical protein
MIFDAFGRLALGQVEQSFVADTSFLTGVSAAGSVGSMRPAISPSTMMGVGAAGSAGAATEDVMPGVHGVSATGSAGIILLPESDILHGVSGTGSAGVISTALHVTTINGVQAVQISPVSIPDCGRDLVKRFRWPGGHETICSIGRSHFPCPRRQAETNA